MFPIPKNVFQVWIGDPANIPKNYAQSHDSIQTFLVSRGWTYRLLFQEEVEDFIKTQFAWFWPTYNSYEHNIQKADAIRPLWLKVYGGVYLDMHFELLAPLDPLFETSDNDAYFLPSPNFPSVYTNAFIAAKPGALVLDLYIAEMVQYATTPSEWHIGKHLTVMNSTGPLALTRALSKSERVFGHLPLNVLAPCSVCDLDNCPINAGPSPQLMRQMTGKTWHGIDSTMIDFMVCKWKYLVGFLCVAIFLGLCLYFYLDA
jgi:mannosyltransferase OCH1-like enzyme